MKIATNDSVFYRYVVVSYDGLGEFVRMRENGEAEFAAFGHPFESYGQAVFARDDLLHASYYCYVKKVKFQEMAHA